MSTDTPAQKDELNAPEAQPEERPAVEEAAPAAETPSPETPPAAAPEQPQPVEVPPVREVSEPAVAPAAAQEAPTPKKPASKPETATSSVASRCFNGLAAVGPLVLILFWFIQSLPTFMGRELHALHDLGIGLLGGAAVSGLPAPDMYPVYHWFVSALSAIPGISHLSLAAYLPGVQPTAGLKQLGGYPILLLPLTTALAALFLILLTWGLARATGNDRRTAFAAGLVLLASLSFMGLPRLSGSDMLFASILTLGGICLYRGWIKTSAPLWLLAGFALIALSTLAGGLLGLVLPLLVSLVFLIWRGTFRRAGARDGALAFGLMLVLLLVWGTMIAFTDGGRDLLKALIENEYLAPLLEAWKLQGRDSWFIVALLALLWLPWTLLLLFLPWGRLGTFLKGIVTNRKQRPGQGWLWCGVIVPLAVLALLGANMSVLLIPVLPPLAILTAQGLLSLSPGGSRSFFLLLAVLLILLGLMFATANLYPLFLGDAPAPLAAIQPSPLPLVAALVQVLGLLLIGVIIWKGVNRAFAGGCLLVLTFLVLLYAAPLTYYAAATAPVIVEVPVTEQAPATDIPSADAHSTTEAPAAAPETPPAAEEQAAPAASAETAPAEPQATALPAPETPSAIPSTEAAPAPAAN